MTLALAALLAVAIVRLWLMPLPSSFWTDETDAVFLVRYGASNASLAASPQLADSIYNVLPRIAQALGGSSETVYRLPSTLALGLALVLIARLTARLIHPEAAWFVVFACLAQHTFYFQAADARPYALGTAIMAAGLWFLVRWLDGAPWYHALLFVVFAALLWPVHPLYWPFYLVFAGYTIVRLVSKDTGVTWRRAAGVFALLALALVPAFLEALALARNAQAHVIWVQPSLEGLFYALNPWMLGGSLVAAWVCSRLWRGPTAVTAPARSSLALIALWWACDPLCLFVFSRETGISLFVHRYYSLALPGAALAGAALAAYYLPPRLWKPLALVLGCGVVALRGDWREPWPPHSDMDWRGAARAIDQATLGSATPIICPSPFIEAQPPVWRPGYPLPSILYAPLVAYPLQGQVVPFPYQPSVRAVHLACKLARSTLPASGRFFVYGYIGNASFWENWFKRRPELAGWTDRRLGSFGDVVAVEFDRPGSR